MNYLDLYCPPLPVFVAGGKCSTSFESQEDLYAIHNLYRLYYIQEGRLTLVRDDKAFTLTAGQYFITSPETPHRLIAECPNETQAYLIFFSSPINPNSFVYQTTSTSSSDRQPIDQSPSARHTQKNNANDFADYNVASQPFTVSLLESGFIAEAERLFFENHLRFLSSPVYPTAVNQALVSDITRHFDEQIAFLRLLVVLYSPNNHATSHQSIAMIVHDYIDRHYCDKIMLKDLAKQHSYNSSHVTRCFHEVYGISPIQYQKQLRIRNAMRLLAFTDMPVKSVGSAVGFHVTSYFIRQFKKETGCTPTQYRARHSGKPDSGGMFDLDSKA